MFARSDVPAQFRDVIDYLIMEAIDDGKTDPSEVVAHVLADTVLRTDEAAVVRVAQCIAEVMGPLIWSGATPPQMPYASVPRSPACAAPQPSAEAMGGSP